MKISINNANKYFDTFRNPNILHLKNIDAGVGYILCMKKFYLAQELDVLQQWTDLGFLLNVVYTNVAPCERIHGKVRHVAKSHQSMMTIEILDDLLQIKVDRSE